MDNAGKIFYHAGWLIGVALLIIAVGQLFAGLEGQETVSIIGRLSRSRVAVGQFVVGVGWLLWWYLSFRPHLADDIAR